MKYAVEVNKLQKSFGKLDVLKDVTFKVREGEILALLGPNGAGKTTTVNILSTLLQPDKGSAQVAGYELCQKDTKSDQRSVSLDSFAAVDEYLTGRENYSYDRAALPYGQFYYSCSGKRSSREV